MRTDHRIAGGRSRQHRLADPALPVQADGVHLPGHPDRPGPGPEQRRPQAAQLATFQVLGRQRRDPMQRPGGALRQRHHRIRGDPDPGRLGGPGRLPGGRRDLEQLAARPDDPPVHLPRVRGRQRPVPAWVVRPLHRGQQRLAVPQAVPDQHRHQPDAVRDERRQLLLHNEPGRQVAASDQQQRDPGPPHPVIDIPPPVVSDGICVSSHSSSRRFRTSGTSISVNLRRHS